MPAAAEDVIDIVTLQEGQIPLPCFLFSENEACTGKHKISLRRGRGPEVDGGAPGGSHTLAGSGCLLPTPGYQREE